MDRKPSGKPTSFDIAYLAGVSQPTVSRALRGSKSVSLATRKRVEAIARELDYSVDKNASSLRSQRLPRSSTIALLFFEDPSLGPGAIDPALLALLGPIVRRSAALGFELLVSLHRSEDDWPAQYRDRHRTGGLILLRSGDDALFEKRCSSLAGQGTRYVQWEPAAGPDNPDAGALLVDRLVALL